jgi:hypothetical protein
LRTARSLERICELDCDVAEADIIREVRTTNGNVIFSKKIEISSRPN